MKTLLLFASLVISTYGTILDTSGALLSRQKRTLVYEEGLNWVQMVVGIGLPIEIKDHSITMGAVVKSYYELPNNSTYYTHPSIDYERRRRKRSTTASRWELYSALEHFAERFGYMEGKSCMLRSICESASIPFETNFGLLGEILHLLLTPSTTEEPVESHFDHEYYAAEKLGTVVVVENENGRHCRAAFPCDSNFMTRFTKVFHAKTGV